MAVALTPLLIPGLAPNFEWSYLGYLPEERQWAPALGLVAGKPTIATGKKGTKLLNVSTFIFFAYQYAQVPIQITYDSSPWKRAA